MIMGLVPARGGSKGLPRKNLTTLRGKPLIAYAIQCGLACASLDSVVVSTDSGEIARVARAYGAQVPFLRPADLAQDATPMLPVLQHALIVCEAFYARRIDTVVLLDPTSPLRTPEDVQAALRVFHAEPPCDAVVSGCTARHSPYFSMVRAVEGYVRLVQEEGIGYGRRQDAPPVYDLDSTVWIYSRAALMDERRRLPGRTRLYEVPQERSWYIDSETDLRIVRMLMGEGVGEP